MVDNSNLEYANALDRCPICMTPRPTLWSCRFCTTVNRNVKACVVCLKSNEDVDARKAMRNMDGSWNCPFCNVSNAAGRTNCKWCVQGKVTGAIHVDTESGVSFPPDLEELAGDLTYATKDTDVPYRSDEQTSTGKLYPQRTLDKEYKTDASTLSRLAPTDEELKQSMDAMLQRRYGGKTGRWKCPVEGKSIETKDTKCGETVVPVSTMTLPELLRCFVFESGWVQLRPVGESSFRGLVTLSDFQTHFTSWFQSFEGHTCVAPYVASDIVSILQDYGIEFTSFGSEHYSLLNVALVSPAYLESLRRYNLIDVFIRESKMVEIVERNATERSEHHVTLKQLEDHYYTCFMTDQIKKLDGRPVASIPVFRSQPEMATELESRYGITVRMNIVGGIRTWVCYGIKLK